MKNKALHPDVLMAMTKHKYLILVQTKKWNAPSPKEAKIMALQCKITKIEREARNLRKENARSKPRQTCSK